MTDLFLRILGISVSTGLLAAALMLLSPLAKGFAAKWRFWIWAVLALRLLIPIGFIPEKKAEVSPAPTDAAAVQTAPAPLPAPAPTYPRIELTVPESFTEPIAPRSEAPAAESKKRPNITPLMLISALWAVGAAVCFGGQIAAFAAFKRRIIKRGKIAENRPEREIFSRLCEEMKMSRAPRLYISNAAPGPMTLGYFKPAIVLPEGEFSAEQLRFILRHELIHHRRRDVWFKLLFAAAVSVHWFNPIVWIMRRRADIDMELSADEGVVGKSSFEEKKAYTEVLYSTAGKGASVAGALSTHFSGGKNVMKKRFNNILSKLNKKNGAVLLALAVVLATAAGALIGCTADLKKSGLKIDQKTAEKLINGDFGIRRLIFSEPPEYDPEDALPLVGRKYNCYRVTDESLDEAEEYNALFESVYTGGALDGRLSQSETLITHNDETYCCPEGYGDIPAAELRRVEIIKTDSGEAVLRAEYFYNGEEQFDEYTAIYADDGWKISEIRDYLGVANAALADLSNDGSLELANEILVFDVSPEFGDGTEKPADLELETADGTSYFSAMRSPYDSAESCLSALSKVFTSEACEKRRALFEEGESCRTVDGVLYHEISEPLRLTFIYPFESAEKISAEEISAKTKFVWQDDSLSDCEIVFKNELGEWKIDKIIDPDAAREDPECICAWPISRAEAGLDGSGVNKLVDNFMIYERAFDYGSLDYASNSPADSVTIDGEIYYPVTEEGFTEWQELYDFMHGLFSDDFADEALAGSPYREHDGKTYTRDVGGNGWSISDKDYRWYDGEKIEIWRPLLSEGDEGKYAITLLYVSGGKITGFEYHYTDSLNGYQPNADISEVNAAFEEFILPPDGETITRLAEEYITENTDLPLHSYTAEYTAITDNVSGIQSGIIEIRYDSGSPYIRLTIAKLDGVWQTTAATEYADYNEYLSEVSGGRPDEVGNVKNVTRNFDIMSVSVDIPESWQSYTLEDYSLQHIGIQLYDGAIPAQREMYGGKLFVAEAVSGFAQSYIESQEALGVSYDVSDYTAASGYKMKLCYRNGVLDYATFDDFKSMCIFFDLDEQDDMRVIFGIIDSIVLSAESGDAPEQSYSYDEAKDILEEAFEAYAQYTSFGSVELSSDGGTAAREIKVRKSDGIFTEYAYCFTARYQSRDRLPRLYAVTADAADIFVYDPEDETDEEFYGYLTTAESYKDVPEYVVFTDFYAQAQAFYKFLQDIDSRAKFDFDPEATKEAQSLPIWDNYVEASLFLHLQRRDNGDIIAQGGAEYIPLNSDYDTLAECEALLNKTFTRDFRELILKNQFGRNRKFSEFGGKMYAIIGDYAGTIVCDLPISGAVYDGENRMTAYTTITYDREGDNVDDYIFHLEKEDGSWKIASIELPDYYSDGSSRFEFTESYYYTDTLAAVETVREALEAEAQSDYVISLEINNISEDWQETYRLAEMYAGSDLAKERGWSDDDLNDRFLVVSADFNAEYDPAKTSLESGHMIRYFGLMYREESDDWEILEGVGETRPAQNP